MLVDSQVRTRHDYPGVVKTNKLSRVGCEVRRRTTVQGAT